MTVSEDRHRQPEEDLGSGQRGNSPRQYIPGHRPAWRAHSDSLQKPLNHSSPSSLRLLSQCQDFEFRVRENFFLGKRKVD